MGRLGNPVAMRFLIANETLAWRFKFLSIRHWNAVRTPKFFCNEWRKAWNEIPA